MYLGIVFVAKVERPLTFQLIANLLNLSVWLNTVKLPNYLRSWAIKVQYFHSMPTLVHPRAIAYCLK